MLASFALNYEHARFSETLTVHADCFDWLREVPENSIHAIVTDPPYGVKEYLPEQLEKRANGSGGVWRIPPSFDGHMRSPLPRFTALSAEEREDVGRFFLEWGALAMRALRPGGHIFIASNTFLSQLVFSALARSGLEFRGEFIRLVRTLRGGDRPKNAEMEFPDVCSMPRGCYEPWGIFRKPLPAKMTVAECLRTYQTGGIRRLTDGTPFPDVFESERTPRLEKDISNHPSLKPQSLMRHLVRAALPLGEGIIVDPFMGGGATVAAAASLGLHCIGIEREHGYYAAACRAIPLLAMLGYRHPAAAVETPMERERQPCLI